jgi:hypothetical protein
MMITENDLSALCYKSREARMKMRMHMGLGIAILWTAAAWAQIYQWTDENGIRHFSDMPPKVSAKDVQSKDALPYDRQADENRMLQEDRILEQYREKREAEEKEEAFKKAQQRELERRAAEEKRREGEMLIAVEREKLEEKLNILDQRLQRLMDYRHLYYWTSVYDYEGAIRRIRRQMRREQLKTEENIQQIREKYGLQP